MAAKTTAAKHATELLIDGAFVRGEGDEEPILNPATGERIVTVREASLEQINKAAAAAHRAFDGWGETTPMERSKLLLKLADAVEARGEEFARLESLNCGKPYARATTACASWRSACCRAPCACSWGQYPRLTASAF